MMLRAWSAAVAAAGWLIGRTSYGRKLALAQRTISGERLAALAEERRRARGCTFFYCSSAGEYEQALPLVEKLAAADEFVLLLFFSPSGTRFAQRRGEKQPYLLAPLDTLGGWQPLFQSLRPTRTIVVRHELWPVFLHCARASGELWLINATTASPSRLSRWTRRRLLGHFHRVCAVDEPAAADLRTHMGVSRERLTITGDTKYDRALSRSRRSGSEIKRLAQRLEEILGPGGRLVAGSCWPADADLIISGIAPLGAEGPKIILAPHQPTEEQGRRLRELCQREGLSHHFFSQNGRPGTAPQVLIFDVLGSLAELYGATNAAFVGGAMDHEVHNVLEPAVHGVPVAFGPHHHNSPEAQQLLARGLATILRRPAEVAPWWQRAERDDRSALREYIESRAGATRAILQNYETLSPGRLLPR